MCMGVESLLLYNVCVVPAVLKVGVVDSAVKNFLATARLENQDGLEDGLGAWCRS